MVVAFAPRSAHAGRAGPSSVLTLAIYRPLTTTTGFRRFDKFSGVVQGSIKVDGTFA